MKNFMLLWNFQSDEWLREWKVQSHTCVDSDNNFCSSAILINNTVHVIYK